MGISMQMHHWLAMFVALVLGWWLGKKGIPNFGG